MYSAVKQFGGITSLSYLFLSHDLLFIRRARKADEEVEEEE